MNELQNLTQQDLIKYMDLIKVFPEIFNQQKLRGSQRIMSVDKDEVHKIK